MVILVSKQSKKYYLDSWIADASKNEQLQMNTAANKRERVKYENIWKHRKERSQKYSFIFQI